MQIFAEKLYWKHLLVRFPNGHYIGSWWKRLGLWIISRSLTPLHISNIYLLEVGAGYLILLLRKLYLSNMFGIGESCIFFDQFLIDYSLCCLIVLPRCVCLFLSLLPTLSGFFSSFPKALLWCIILWRTTFFHHFLVC